MKRVIGWTCSLLVGSTLACGPLDWELSDIPDEALWQQVRHEPDYPRHREHCWSHEAQGVTHDEDSWYITTNDDIFKYPVTADLVQCDHAGRVGLPSWSGPACPAETCRCEHFGDPTFHDGELYVPVEDCFARSPGRAMRLPNRVFVYDRRLQLVRVGTLDPDVQSHASWVAINPATGELWSGTFTADHINVYAASFERHARLRHLRSIPLDREYRGVQGLAFDGQGGVYLASFDTAEPERSGIHVFSVQPGQAVPRPRQLIRTRGYSQGFGRWHEVQGVTFWNVDGRGAPGIAGQLHWVVLDNDADQDDVSLSHVSLAGRAPAAMELAGGAVPRDPVASPGSMPCQVSVASSP